MKPMVEEIIQRLISNRPVCVCKPFCGHWEAHAAKVLSSYLSGHVAEMGIVQLRNAVITYAKKHGPLAAIKFAADQVGVIGLIGDSEVDEARRFQEHLDDASREVATWEPWEQNIFGGQCGVIPCRCRCGHSATDHVSSLSTPCDNCSCNYFSEQEQLSSDADIPDLMSLVIAYVKSRRDYFAGKDLHNGWSGRESGPCCERCEMRAEHFTGRADALKAVVGCRNPFQGTAVCQCHLPTRKAVRAGIVEAHDQLLRHFMKGGTK